MFTSLLYLGIGVVTSIAIIYWFSYERRKRLESVTPIPIGRLITQKHKEKGKRVAKRAAEKIVVENESEAEETCRVCGKRVKNDAMYILSKRFKCEICGHRTHLHCADIRTVKICKVCANDKANPAPTYIEAVVPGKGEIAPRTLDTGDRMDQESKTDETGNDNRKPGHQIPERVH